MKLLFDLFPILVFFLAYQFGNSNPESAQHMLAMLGLPGVPDGKPGVYLATVAAIVATLAQILWLKLKGQKIETMLWVSLALIVVFGGMTLYFHDERFIKWKPTVLYWLFAVTLLGAAVLGRNLMKTLLGGKMQLPDPAWNKLNLSWAGFFAFMGLANILIATNFSTDVWVNFKLFGGLALMLIFIVVQSLMLAKYLPREPRG
jgi:intracellular septation protein